MVKIRFVNLNDSNDPGLSLDSIDQFFPSGSSVDHTLVDYYRGGSYVDSYQSRFIPESGQISILDFQGAGDSDNPNVPGFFGMIVTGGNSSDNLLQGVQFPSWMEGKHFGCILVSGGGGAGEAPGGGGGGGATIYVPKGIPYHAGQTIDLRVSRGGAGGYSARSGGYYGTKGSSGTSTEIYIDRGPGVPQNMYGNGIPMRGPLTVPLLRAEGGWYGQGTAGTDTGAGGAGGYPQRWFADGSNYTGYVDSAFRANPLYDSTGFGDSYPGNDDIQISSGGRGGNAGSTFTGGIHGGGGGGVGGFNFGVGPWVNAPGHYGTILNPRGGSGWNAPGFTNSTGNGEGGVLSAGGGGRAGIILATSETATNFQSNSGGGIFDSSFDKSSIYYMDRGVFTGTPQTGFQDAQGIPLGTSSNVTTGSLAPKKNVFVGNSNIKNTPATYYKLTNTNKTDGSKNGGEGQNSKSGGHGIYGGKDGNERRTGAATDFGTDSIGRIYNPNNWGGGGGGASHSNSNTGTRGFGVSGGPGIAILFGPTPSKDSNFLTTEGGEIIVPHIFPTADNFFFKDLNDSSSWSTP